jgi:isocitrate/isopropylmalate dehydrogenase
VLHVVGFNKPAKRYFSKIQEYDKSSRVLMKLFFNKIDACIIPQHTWEMMREMNPQIDKKLKVLDRSEKIFLSALSLISKKMNDKLYLVHKNNALKLKNSSKGKQILTLLKGKIYKSVDKAFMDPMVDYYQEYLALKKR